MSPAKPQFQYGISLPNGSRIVHGTGANIKIPFQDLGFPVTMCELSANSHTTLSERHSPVSFSGSIGVIEFDTSIRLPRHVHIAPLDPTDAAAVDPSRQRFVAERILVLAGMALVQLNAEVYVIPPKSLVTIAPGVPHTWTACPAGVSPTQMLGNGLGWDADMMVDADQVVSTGKFTMVYEYEEETGFFPTKQTETLSSVAEYERCPEGDLDSIRIAEMSAEEVARKGWYVWGRECAQADGTKLTE